jgi:SAM-dependent methyltransferase
MPAGVDLPREGMLYQREQYAKSWLTRLYWDYKDEKEIEPLAGAKRIVEFGCGEGITLERMVKRFVESLVLGLDLDPENISILKEHGLPAIQGNVLSPCFKPSSLDAVLLAEVLEHIREPQVLIQSIRHVLRPGGLLVLVVPNDDFFYWARILSLKFKEARYDSGHVRKWSPKDVRLLLEREGFEVFFKRNLPFRLWVASLHHLCVARKNS